MKVDTTRDPMSFNPFQNPWAIMTTLRMLEPRTGELGVVKISPSIRLYYFLWYQDGTLIRSYHPDASNICSLGRSVASMGT